MQKINYWRVAALVLLGLVGVMGYQMFRLLDASPVSINAAQPMKMAKGAESDQHHQVILEPRWPSVQLPDAEVSPDLDLKHDYNFDRDWHTRHTGFWAPALERFKGKPNVTYLEIGLFEGASFFWVLEKILTDPSAHATGVDPFIRTYSKIQDYGDTFMDNLKLSGEEERTTIVTGFSQEVIRTMPLNSFDIIYIDGSHDARDVLEDAILAWRLLKDGGVLIFDDYELWWDRPASHQPRFGIDVFYTFYRNEFDVTHFGYQVMLTKKLTG